MFTFFAETDREQVYMCMYVYLCVFYSMANKKNLQNNL